MHGQFYASFCCEAAAGRAEHGHERQPAGRQACNLAHLGEGPDYQPELLPCDTLQ
jgi:hypothetical protein